MMRPQETNDKNILVDFHPDTWNPAWSVGTILTGLLSFMLETTPTLGSIETTYQAKKNYAKTSSEFNLKNKIFFKLFPDICDEIREKLKEQQDLEATETEAAQKKKTKGSAPGSTNNNVIGNGSADGAESEAGDQPAQSDNSNAPDGKTWQSVLLNLIVLICFALMAMIVNYIINL